MNSYDLYLSALTTSRSTSYIFTGMSWYEKVLDELESWELEKLAFSILQLPPYKNINEGLLGLSIDAIGRRQTIGPNSLRLIVIYCMIAGINNHHLIVTINILNSEAFKNLHNKLTLIPL